jgi:hypothetical protein
MILSVCIHFIEVCHPNGFSTMLPKEYRLPLISNQHQLTHQAKHFFHIFHSCHVASNTLTLFDDSFPESTVPLKSHASQHLPRTN